MDFSLALLAAGPAPQSTFVTDAPLGTGLEWMTIASVIVPAVLIVVLTYLGRQQTVNK
jgi:hypothetical protein